MHSCVIIHFILFPLRLTIEFTDEDAMYYRAAASDLMKDGQVGAIGLVSSLDNPVLTQTWIPVLYRNRG